MFKSEISPAYKVNLLFFILRYKCAIYAYAISASFFPHLSLCLSYDMSVPIYAYAISAFFFFSTLCVCFTIVSVRVFINMLFLLAEGFLFLVLISLTVTFPPHARPRVRAWPLSLSSSSHSARRLPFPSLSLLSGIFFFIVVIIWEMLTHLLIVCACRKRSNTLRRV